MQKCLNVKLSWSEITEIFILLKSKFVKNLKLSKYKNLSKMFPSKIVKMLQDGEMSKIIIAKFSINICSNVESIIWKVYVKPLKGKRKRKLM